MIGKSFSHYRIVGDLGAGGMGVVYKAIDTRLNRHVAIKFLSHDLTQHAHANERFIREAHAASALDHPNICTIYEIDDAPGHGIFLVMAYYEGETVKQRLERGPLTVDEALDIAEQVARGLSRAHESGIVHRDIKPANLLITRDGLVKILDFGLATLADRTDVTRSGTTHGTVAYMAPELIRGDEGDARADVWALGVTIYELLAGRRPFVGKDDLAVLSSVLDRDPEPIGAVRGGVPDRLAAVVSKSLEKDVGARYPAANSVLADLVSCRTDARPRPAKGAGALILTKPVVLVATALIAVAAVAAGASVYRRRAHEDWARTVAIPEVTRLVGMNQRAEAFALAREIDAALPGDPALAAVWRQVSVDGSMVSTPPGADVYFQDYSAVGASWEPLGKTPLENVRLPRGTLRFRLEKDGFEPRLLASTNPGSLLRNLETPYGGAIEVTLVPKGTSPDMVPVSAGRFPVSLSGFNTNQRYQMDEFLIDRLEVTNAEFKRFVDSGGYARAEYWPGRPEASMVDSTGHPGPSTWELGRFPEGHEQFPVSGVSWFEAVAYCRAQNKSLPTLYHWARAGLAPIEIQSPLAPAMIPLSHVEEKGPAAAGSSRGVGPYGTYDMAGNVREWAWNESSGGRRWIMGGAWSDPQWLMVVPSSLPPDDRSATNGFRCMRTIGPTTVPEAMMASVDHFAGRREFTPVSEEVYAVFKRQLAYQPGPANIRVEKRDESNANWIKETISFDAGYDGERALAYLFLPRSSAPPFQLAVYFGPLNDFLGRRSSENVQPGGNDFIVRSGRAFLYPVFKGSFERWDNFVTLQGEEYDRTFRTRMFQWRQELGRVLDGMAERPDIDADRMAYVSLSFGSSTSLALLAIENRLKAAVLSAPGLPFRRLPPEVDPINFVRHITLPVLMLGGRLDFVLPVETAQKPMFEALGTPADRKRHVIFDSGHADYPRSGRIRETLAWLDRYLGPVSTRSGMPTP